MRPDDGNETTGPRGDREAEARDDLLRAHEQLATARRELLGELERAERELAAARGEVERSHRELERVARVASHDLRAPLRAVKGFSDLLSRRYGDRLDEEGTELLDFIGSAARRMDGLIAATVDLARTASAPLASEPVALEDLLAETLAKLRPILEGAEVEAAALPVVRGDAKQLGRLLEHLLANAAAFRGERPLRIRVDAERAPEGVIVQVADNGVGIAPRDRERVLEAFAQLDPEASEGRAGIGLTVARTIAERHGGRLWIEDSPLGGAAVRVALPAA